MNARTVLLLLFALSVPAAGADELVYTTPAGVTFTVTARGLSAIAIGGRTLAAGGWSAGNAEGWFNVGTGTVQTTKEGAKTFEKRGPARARVTHVRGDITCVFDYSFSGEDVTISARIRNDHPTAAMEAVGFSGLAFSFDRPPAGLMYVQHVSYFRAHGVGLCHPGHWARIGGSYAVDDTVGVGLSPWNTGVARTLILWDYADWRQGRRENVPRRRLRYFSIGTVPPRGARTIDLRMRVSPNRDWTHLLAPYREHFRRTFGALQYEPDCRWIATDYLNHSQRAVSPENPCGFHGGHRRIDTADGAQQFCRKHIAALKEAGGQGVIVWGQGGDDPRGCMYRPDFDVLPPAVDEHWKTIAERFAAAGLRLGVCTRPRHLAVRKDWQRDRIVDINPADAGHRAMLLDRFRNMIDRGCSLFYLDSFGSSFEDVILMRFLRAELGPGVLTFCEHQCDAIVPLSGGYSETTLHAKEGQTPHYRVWSGLRNWEIYRYLVPGAQLAARHYRTEGTPPDTVEPADGFFFRHRITPLVPAPRRERLAILKTLQPRYVDADGGWKETGGE